MLSSAILSLLLLTTSPPPAAVAPAAPVSSGLRVSAPRIIELDLPLARKAFALTIPLKDGPLTLDIAPSSLRADTFSLLIDDGNSAQPTEAPAPRTWRGHAYRPGMSAGVVAATIHDRQLRALVRFEGGEILAIQPTNELDDRADDRSHVLYNDYEISPGDETCGTTESPKVPEIGGAESFGTIKIAEIAIEADTFFYQAMGSSVPDTFLDIEAVLNAVSVIYEEEVGITYALTTLVIQTGATDKYSSSKHEKLLTQFRSRWNDDFDHVDRDTAHLMTGRSIQTNVVGLAFVGVICEENFAYGFSESTFTSNFSLRTALTAHELGHNWNAGHCNGIGDCSIMCATLGQCSGNVTGFGGSEEGEILSYKSSISCLQKLPTPTTAPFLDTFSDSSLTHKNWSSEGGAFVSTSAWAETSGARSVNLDAKKNGKPDVLYSRGFDVTAMTDPVLAFFSQHRGVGTGEPLAVEYQTSTGAWLPLGQVSSDGVDQNTFASSSFTLPVQAEHACVRFRFRADVDDKKDEWFVDDIRIIENPGTTVSALLDPSGISALRFEFSLGSTTPAQDTVDVINGGNGGASLGWTASAVEGASFTSPTPASGTVIPAESEDTLTITVDPTGLAAGIHHATVRVQNTGTGADFIDVPITVLIFDATSFIPGHLLTGSVDNPGEMEAGAFQSIAGAKLKMTFQILSGDLKPVITVRGEDGEIIEKFKVKSSPTKAKVKFTSSEMVRIEVTGKGQTTGTFDIQTSLSVPDEAGLHSSKAKPASAGEDVDVELLSTTETRCNLTVSPAKDDGGPFTAELLSPTGQSRGLLPFREFLPTGGQILRDIPLSPGTHTLRLSGFAAKEKLVITFDPSSMFVPGVGTVDL